MMACVSRLLVAVGNKITIVRNNVLGLLLASPIWISMRQGPFYRRNIQGLLRLEDEEEFLSGLWFTEQYIINLSHAFGADTITN